MSSPAHPSPLGHPREGAESAEGLGHVEERPTIPNTILSAGPMPWGGTPHPVLHHTAQCGAAGMGWEWGAALL